MNTKSFFKAVVKGILEADGVSSPELRARDVVILPGGKLAISMEIVALHLNGHEARFPIFRGYRFDRLSPTVVGYEDILRLGTALDGTLFLESSAAVALLAGDAEKLDFKGYILPSDQFDFVGCLVEALNSRLALLEGRRQEAQVSEHIELSPQDCVRVGRALLVLGCDWASKREIKFDDQLDDLSPETECG